MTLSKPRTYALVAVLVVAAILTLAMARAAAADTSGPGYEITWYTVDGGGGASSGGDYALDGTIGQADAGSLNGGAYVLAGGFWAGLTTALYNLFLPLVNK
jgi:hypothetical protein